MSLAYKKSLKKEVIHYEKNILILSTSPRKGGNSDTLADEFTRGARDAGHDAEKISLAGKTIGFCRGCLACQKTERCVIQDDVNAIVQKMLSADVLVFATPIYFYEMSGQMKTLLDRSNPLFPADYAFREIYLLAASADENRDSMDGAVKGLQGWIDCFERAKLAGVLRGTGLDAVGAAKNAPLVLKAAYDMGKTL